MNTRRVALVHDWLTGMRGGEKVLEVLCKLFPQADLFTLVHVPGNVSSTIERHRIFTSPLQKLPGIGSYYRRLLPLMPWAIEQFNFQDYDLVISTSHCVAKGAVPAPHAIHWCYCHTPMRYIWDQFGDYFGPGRASWLTRSVMHRIRPRLQRWDLDTTPRVHHFLANSQNVQERIQRIYQRKSEVVYPPVDVDFYSQTDGDKLPVSDAPFFLVVSALAPYKRIDLAIRVFNTLGHKLVIVGDGQESKNLRQMAKPNIQFLGWLDPENLRRYYRQCKALLFPGEEDFGIVPLEAMAAGRPVIAFHKGGALETIVESKTGLFFANQTETDFLEALRRFESMSFSPRIIQEHAKGFDVAGCESHFRRLFIEYLA